MGREQGGAFVSVQLSGEEAPADIRAGLWEPETYASLYGEYGFGNGLTGVLDIGTGTSSRMGQAYLRYTLTDAQATWQIAVDGGVGARQYDDEDPHGLLRIGASIGRGFGAGGTVWYSPLEHHGGWISLDTYALYDATMEQVIWQAEGTAGFNLSDRFATILAVNVEDWPDADPRATFFPSLLFRVNDRTSLRIGGQAALAGGDNLGLSLAIWQEF